LAILNCNDLTVSQKAFGSVEMQILLQSNNEQEMQNIQVELSELIASQCFQDTLQAGTVMPQISSETHRGDPATIYTVLVAAVSAGGALTIAMGKDGFLTQLARVLEKYIEGGNVRIKIKSKDKELEMEGSARRIEKMLGEVIKHTEQEKD
jgi:hypothetical protein